MNTDFSDIRQPLEHAMLEMGKVWPVKFSLSEVNRSIALFARPLKGIDPQCLMTAALEWMDKNKWAPTPSEFARYAWKVHRDMHPSDPVETINPAHHDPEIVKEGERVRTIQENLDARARYILKCMDAEKPIDRLRQVSDVWALLWDRAQSDEERKAVKNGTVSRREVNEAIRAYRAGQRARDYRALRAVSASAINLQDSGVAIA